MSTLADWDAEMAAEVISAADAVDITTPVRYDSDLRRGRVPVSGTRFQIRHAQQPSDSRLSSGVSFAVVDTVLEFYHRLGIISGFAVESEHDYTADYMALFQDTITRASTWLAKASVRRVVSAPVVSLPEAVSLDVIGFQMALTVELAP